MKSLHLSCITILKGAALRRSLRAEKRSYNFTQIRRFSTATRSHSTKPPLCKPSLSELQSSSNKKHSTTTLDFAHSSPSIITTQSATTTPKPSKAALKTLFTASAIPMIGFGFMDNFVMIQAGQYIDSTLGVSLGLATMTAAAAGTYDSWRVCVCCWCGDTGGWGWIHSALIAWRLETLSAHLYCSICNRTSRFRRLGGCFWRHAGAILDPPETY